MVSTDAGRPNQRTRTRKALLDAASRLMRKGRRPTLDEIAEDALVSRATAYRYFPSVEALLIEAPIEDAVPGPDDVFGGASPVDPVERLDRVDAALHDMISANELPLRLMLASSVQRAGSDEAHSDLPARQNRRTALIEAALAPARSEFTPTALKTLTRSLALIIGTESMVVLKDVLQLDEPAARKVRHWAIRALVDAARKPDSSN